MKNYELACILQKKGYIISFPLEKCKYEFIVDVDGQVKRVAVRTTSVLDRTSRHNRYKVNISSNGKPFSYEDVDLIAVYLHPAFSWYIIPYCEIYNKTSISFHADSSKNKYKKYML